VSSSSTTDGSTELRDGYAEVGDVRLHYVEAGDGPLIVLLHGFPEFWYAWRLQIAPLAAAGSRVVAPDLRGYHLSSKPDGVGAYGADALAADVYGLIQERGAESAHVVGHDWGGTAAWTLAMNPAVAKSLGDLPQWYYGIASSLATDTQDPASVAFMKIAAKYGLGQEAGGDVWIEVLQVRREGQVHRRERVGRTAEVNGRAGRRVARWPAAATRALVRRSGLWRIIAPPTATALRRETS
jgi:pimeloyl-ACP methyl ester carboxylesterase